MKNGLGLCEMKKKRRTAPRGEIKKKHHFKGCGAHFTSSLRRFFPSSAVTAAVFFVCAAVTALTHSAPAYVLTAVSALAMGCCVAAASAGCTLRDAADMRVFAAAPKKDKAEPPSAWMVALSETAAFSAVSAGGAVVVFLSTLMITDGALAAACALVFLSASVYFSTLVSAVSAYHDPRGGEREGRRGFIKGFVGFYTAGLAALMLFLFPASYIPLGDDFKTDSIPHTALLALSLLYLTAAVLRVCILFFILRRRLDKASKIKK